MFSLKFSKKIIIYFSLFALAIFGCFRSYYNLTDDFRQANITYDMPNRPEWDILSLSPSEKSKIDQILNQTFTYIGKGAQSYAFGSEDGKYVLKFFKFKHLKPSLFVDLLPSVPPFINYKMKQTERKTRKLEGVFAGYRLAYESHREDSGLLFIHLNKTDNLGKTAIVLDKMGWEHKIPLDDVVFILQYKAETMRKVMHDLLAKDNVTLAKHRINQIIDLYLSEYRKGIFDHDHGVMHNAGFVSDRPIHLDVGKLKKNDSMRTKETYAKDIELVVRRMDKWLKENEPKHHPELAAHIEEKMNQIIGEPFHL